VICCAPLERTDSASDLAGDYTRGHRVFVFHGNEAVPVDVADRLVLAAVDEGALDVRLQLFADNGRECALAGRATRRRGGFGYQEVGPAGECEIRIEADNERITVTDVESRCSAAHCREFGPVGRVFFAREPR
jgi:hypothetical protein